MDIDFLKEVASFIGSSKIEEELSFLSTKDEDCPLVLPLVGEFSSGKTTLLNALTDSKQLETAVKPTTATIYEIYFGHPKCCAEIYYTDKPKVNVDKISDLHNSEIADAAVVEVYDTSTRVPSSIVLVDTPGLSSSNPKHQQTLVDFLPQADGILLVSDCNQPGLTKSLSDFIKKMKLSTKQLYLILTKCDTKSISEINDSKRYIAECNGINSNNIVSVSAMTDNLQELLNLLSKIQKEKAQILEQVNKQRGINIARQLIDAISSLKKASISDKGLNDAIKEQELKLKQIDDAIKRMIDSLADDIEKEKIEAKKTFRNIIETELDTVVGNKSANYDAEAIAIINHTASLVITNLRTAIHNLIRDYAAKNKSDIQFPSLYNIDLSSFSIGDLAYDLNLNCLGHEYDSKIAAGLKIAAAVATVYAVPNIAPAYIPDVEDAESSVVKAEGIECGGTNLAIGAAQNAVIVKDRKDFSPSPTFVTTQVNRKDQIMQKYDEYEQHNQAIGQKMGMSAGLVESLVGLVTDHTMGRPQRKKAIQSYLDTTLLPNFEASITLNCNTLLSNIKKDLLNDATTTITQVQTALNNLKTEKESQESDFCTKMRKIDEYSLTLKNKYLCGNL